MRRLRSPVAALALVAAAVSLSGCAPEDPQQRAARLTAEQWASTRPAYTGEAHCTDSAAYAWFGSRFTPSYVCAVHRTEGSCDWLEVHFDADRGTIRTGRVDRAAGCTLPI